MSERTTLIKKAVLTSVGASSNFDRIKDALEGAMQDLVKVGQDLIDDLEEQGKVKTENAQSFIRGLQDEATKKTGKLEAKVSVGVRSKAKDLGLVTREEYEELLERIEALETSVNGPDTDGSKKKSKSKKSSTKEEGEQKED